MGSSSNQYKLPKIPISPIVHESRLNVPKKTSPRSREEPRNTAMMSGNRPAQRSNSTSLKKV